MNRIIKTVIVLIILILVILLWSYIVDHMPAWMLNITLILAIGVYAKIIYDSLK